jgi:hypothetical protein
MNSFPVHHEKQNLKDAEIIINFFANFNNRDTCMFQINTLMPYIFKLMNQTVPKYKIQAHIICTSKEKLNIIQKVTTLVWYTSQ